MTITGSLGKKNSEKFLDYTSSQLLLQDLHKNLDKGIENIMLILALSTGLRYGELIGLCINDLDFKNNRIKVHHQWQYKEGGGFGTLKTEKSERTISTDKLTMNALKKHINTVKNDQANIHDLVFFEPTSEISVVTNDKLNDSLRATLNRLGIRPLITVHGLRHTHSSILLYKGISILYVSERLGHSNIDITTSTYAHVLKELRERDSVHSSEIFEQLLAM
ncbi:Integrase [Lysinibacillus sphaericus]|nr:Integrase [Lysinibacillus sphaericus]